MSELRIDVLIGEPLARCLGVSGRPASEFCTETGLSRHGSGPHIAATYNDGRRFIVGACAAARCRALHAELVSELRARIARDPTEGPIVDMPGFLLAVQQRLLGRSVQA